MSEQDDKKSEVEDEETEDEVESSPESAPPVKTRPSTRKRAEQAAAAKPAPAASMPAARAGMFVVLALAAGGAAGWFGHIQQAKAAHVRADSVPVTVSSSGVPSGPCGDWQKKICDSGGKTSASCQQAKGAAAELLMPSTCQAGLEAMPATLARLKAARASCDTLVGKLCTDLPPGSSTCDMVKERTPSFPAKRCEEMLKSYDKVLEELRSIDQQGGMPGAPGMPPGAPGMRPGMPPGMPPGAH